MPEPAPIDAGALVDRLADTGRRLVVVATGGGAAAVPALVSIPGASRVVVEAIVPYARESVDRWLGGRQESYCSSRAARRLAMMAWQRARGLGAAAEAAVGVAATASLRSREPKRGDHRVVVAVQTLESTSVATLVLTKDARSRAEEETVVALLLLDRLAAHAGDDAPHPSPQPRLFADERLEVATTAPPPEWRELLAGTRRCVSAARRPGEPAGPPVPGMLVFPGSFDPLHAGHLRMALIAEEIAERPLTFELSVTNVDKPALDYIELAGRTAQFAGRALWLTAAATFVEKLDLFPQATFVMGADTFARLADPRYYGGSAAAADDAARRIAAEARGLIVFGRERDGGFVEPAKLDVPAPLRDAAYCVSEREFRMDVSSTALRRQAREDA